MILAIASAKGAPGVTTLALAAALANDTNPTTVIEADEAGTSLTSRFTLDGNRGLSTLYRRPFDASALRMEAQAITVSTETQPIPVVIGLPSEGRRSRLRTYWEDFAGDNSDLIVDAGRCMTESVLQHVFEVADMTVIACRPSIEGVFHAEHLARRLQNGGWTKRCGIVVIGGEPYSRHDVARSFSVPVIGWIPNDPKTAAALEGLGVAPKKFLRTPLIKAATDLISNVTVAVSTPQLEQSA